MIVLSLKLVLLASSTAALADYSLLNSLSYGSFYNEGEIFYYSDLLDCTEFLEKLFQLALFGVPTESLHVDLRVRHYPIILKSTIK